MLDDLARRFLEDHETSNEREAVAHYGHYFLGSIVISAKNGQKYIIDGQQRLTTLTLLLIYLNNLQRGRDEQVSVKELIFSEKYGKRSFNLDVPERARCMEALFSQEEFDPTDQPESIRNIAARYADIEALFPDELKGDALPYFMDWLIDNVHLVEITAYSDEDAYTIFETMNDRGLSLSPTDMLKGYLLANITDEEKRNQAVDIWKKHVGELAEWDGEESADFFKAWLRSQYANSIRERKKGAHPRDFDRLGTEFHRWVREQHEHMGLHVSDDFYRFFERDLAFFARQYKMLRKASKEYLPGMEDVFHVAQLGFTLQYPVMLAPLQPSDDEETVQRKVRIVAAYLEILLARRLWNWRTISYSTMQYAMFLVMKEIRGQSPEALTDLLTKRLEEQEETFASNERFGMHKMNRYMIHRLLARMTDTLERGAGRPSHYLEYINVLGDRRNPYEVEHIWADRPDRHTDEFNHPVDFAEYRNRIGGLVLLPKKFNASYGDLPYEEKLPHYIKHNLLVASLHPQAYERDPGFQRFIEQTGLPFKPHKTFKKADLDTRQKLYIALAAYTWRPERLREVLT